MAYYDTGGAAAFNVASFTKKLPYFFTQISITRKMHLLEFIIPPIFKN